jgi:cytochrome b subunit of formate dehydrogenase
MAEAETGYLRFTPGQRVQHWVMTLSFTLLAVTGLPQRYALADWAEGLIAVLGGIETVRVIHRAAAVVFILVTLYHFVHVAYKVVVLRVQMSMLPGLKDVTDLLDAVRWNLGLARRRPRLPRYNFAEKIEYWSLIWGTLLMILTGFMLWNPIATTHFLPGEVIPAAKTAHSAEALLAVLAVLIWHFYGVHIKHFNRSMFTGRLSRGVMAEEHAAELEAIEAGRVRPSLGREVKRRRERAFLPVATVLSLGLVLGVYWFVTLETTALTTVPPAETVQAFVPATPTPTRTPTVTPSPTATPLPTPTWTPGPEATAGVAQAGEAASGGLVIPHAVAGREECLACHAAGAMRPFPADHEGRTNVMCLACHVAPASGTEAAPAGQETLGNLASIPHEVEGREDCLLCHAAGAMLPVPADHEGRTNVTCLVCHAVEGEAGHVPAAVKHDLEGRENCLMCHAADLLPLSHKTAAFSNSDCLLCHVPGSAASPTSSTVDQSSTTDGG